jgi:hypothetical protein
LIFPSYHKHHRSKENEVSACSPNRGPFFFADLSWQARDRQGIGWKKRLGLIRVTMVEGLPAVFRDDSQLSFVVFVDIYCVSDEVGRRIVRCEE